MSACVCVRDHQSITTNQNNTTTLECLCMSACVCVCDHHQSTKKSRTQITNRQSMDNLEKHMRKHMRKTHAKTHAKTTKNTPILEMLSGFQDRVTAKNS